MIDGTTPLAWPGTTHRLPATPTLGRAIWCYTGKYLSLARATLRSLELDAPARARPDPAKETGTGCAQRAENNTARTYSRATCTPHVARAHSPRMRWTGLLVLSYSKFAFEFALCYSAISRFAILIFWFLICDVRLCTWAVRRVRRVQSRPYVRSHGLRRLEGREGRAIARGPTYVGTV